MIGKWTDWRPFPDPTKGDFITAPFGAGCYELRLSSGELVLFGSASNVAYRMCSLHPDGAGTRNNSGKRAYIGDRLSQIEYRVIALANRKDARDFERHKLWSQRDQYIFKT
jgi:DNA integrity scanning protein DisA with diadenylate cyclase activity